jgi:hypothetical protein
MPLEFGGALFVQFLRGCGVALIAGVIAMMPSPESMGSAALKDERVVEVVLQFTYSNTLPCAASINAPFGLVADESIVGLAGVKSCEFEYAVNTLACTRMATSKARALCHERAAKRYATCLAEALRGPSVGTGGCVPTGRNSTCGGNSVGGVFSWK